MRNETEVPAALPLIIVIASLAAARHAEGPAMTAIGLVAIAALVIARRPRVAGLLALSATALLTGAHDHSMRRDEKRAVSRLDAARFVTIEAPIERDWSARPHYSALRSSSFRAESIEVHAPLTIYARFRPRDIEMEAVVRAEGLLREDGRGGFSMSLKSPRLLRYDGRLNPWSPAAWNRRMANRLRGHASAHPHEIALIEALLLGRGERLSEEAKENFRRGGTYHLLVFSGLQISLAAAAIALLLRWVGAPRAADWSLLAFSLVAPAFIGHEASVSRASTVIALFAISRIVRRPTSPQNLWCVAAIARLLLVPADLLDPAFHLTYAGAGALLFIGAPLSRTRMRWVAYAVAAEIAIVPLTLFHFHQYAIGGSIATVVMTPIVFAMLLAGAAFIALESLPFLHLIAGLDAICSTINDAAAFGSGFYASPPALAMCVAAAGGLCALATLRGGKRTAAVVASLLIAPASAVVAMHVRAEAKTPSMTVLDVGQGDAILIRSLRNVILVDGGGRHGDARFGESVLLPLLLDRGVRRIDTALLTHAHPDHCLGLAAAVRHLEVRELWISPRQFRGACAHALLDVIRASGTAVRIVRGGEPIVAGEWSGEVFFAGRRYRRAPENNNSLIVSLRARGRSILLTGDIERDAERDLADFVTPHEVLKIPHHGSKTSTSPRLLDAVRPRLAIVSCGRNNVFGHPHPAVIDGLRRRRIGTFRTDRDGSVDVTLDNERISVQKERGTASRASFN